MQEMNLENTQDVTDEVDVSEAVQEVNSDDIVDQGVSIDTVQTFKAIPEGMTVLNSMDGNKYLLNLSTVDWAETASEQNMQNINANEEFVRAVFREVIFAHTMADTDPDAAQKYETGPAIDTVRAYVDGFGLKPLYKETYPNASDYDIDIMWCIDALEITRVVRTQCEIWRATHPTTETEEGGNENETDDNSAD